MTEDLTERREDLSERRATRALVTPRLRLRPVAKTDAEAIANLISDRDVAKMLSRVPWPYHLEDAEAFIANHGDEIVFAICPKAGGDLAGLCSLKLNPEVRRAEIGYWIGRPYWGNGYATEAAQSVIDYGFVALDLRAIDVSCRVINEASRRVIWKCGFHFCGNGMIDTVASGRVASEHFTMDRSCWTSLKAWGCGK
ncbi:GNAT family N-acetyltransferase [Aurantimonas sp. VKM B-3413]|uniref:GNAT family N-acetyltransferase n=1 Tax=Aurantimonas sp. VKM B-3413 TaxID=2779401 RepID=UPI001E63246B|nr:GNAT family N-acetyltransferase [Aurantimonas sp. VKM B-3413]MCB8836651.1 GNAT family N-acetyltransferase [Aurantimonas sp. VKM B-3413]